MSDVTADVVVAGAGHNSLITAAYLALAGREVVVLDSRPIPGGGAVSEELMGPGYVLDSCSTGHTLIQTNPVLAADELGLIGDYGLDYLVPDPFAHVAFPDGEQLTGWMDRERTVEEIAFYCRADAAAYRRLLADYDEVKHIFGAATFTPIGFGPSLDERLREHPKGDLWRRRAALSAWDVIRHEFEDPHVQAFLLWQAYQTLVPVDAPGSGTLAYSIVFGRQRRSWTLPRGGSGQLTDTLVRCIEDRGGTVLCGRRVHRLVLEDGRCAGVECETGERFLARDAVVSTIHVKHLVDMAPAEAVGRRVPLRGRDVRRRRAVQRHVPGHLGAAGVRDPRRAAHRRVGRPRRLAAGDDRLRPRAARRPLGGGPALGARRDADARRPVARAGRAPHGEVPRAPVLRLRGAARAVRRPPDGARRRGLPRLHRPRCSTASSGCPRTSSATTST